MEKLTAAKTKELKKHVAAIHRSNELSLLQGKISNALLYNAYHRLTTEIEHQISISKLCEIIGYRGNNIQFIKDALKGLVATLIEWNILDDKTGEEDWTASSLLASVRIKGSICTYAYSPRMKELLYSPRLYGRINMLVQAKFKSAYGLALYENCVRYRDLPLTRWFELELFRKLMGVTKNTYPIFRDFKRRVIDKAVEEVNLYSDLSIEPEYEKIGRQIKRLRFHISERKKKPKLGLVGAGEVASDDSLVSEILGFGVNAKIIDELFNVYERDYVEEKVRLIKDSKAYKENKIKNVAAYFIESLRSDYKDTSKSNSTSAKQSPKENEQQANWQQEYQEYHNNFLLMQLANLEDLKRNGVFAKFESELEKKKTVQDDFNFRLYKVVGIKDKLIMIRFTRFIKDFFPEILNGALGLDEFIKSKSAND